LNLLQPQDRRSQDPGDSKETALARRRLEATGHADPVYQALGHVIRSRSQAGPFSLLDVGCGEGSFLRSLAGIPGLERHGLDISAPSIEMAARASPEILFVVANADRFMPYADRSFDFVTSIDARANGDEFARVLSTRGLVLFAVPGPDDLMELRERIQGGKALKSRTTRVEEELARHFTLADKMLVRETRTFEPPVLRDLLSVTYRGFRQSERAAVESLSAMSVTLCHEILAFQPR
jgi:23S rRNA (guanine745-N1)-methyltransferase